MMRFLKWAAAAPILLAGTSALAGETVLYGPPAAWIQTYEGSKIDLSSKDTLLVFDVQERIDDDGLTRYFDRAYRLDTPEALTQSGTVSELWLPEQGDLTIHRVEILRGNQVIDVLAGGAVYTVLRRETQLERRQLDGALTATMVVPGLQIGDTLRISSSQTIDDSTLQGEVQANSTLLSWPTQVAFARTEISWPRERAVRWMTGPDIVAPEETEKNGFRYVSLTVPLAKRPDMPGSAPSRYSRPQTLQAATFRDWEQVSQIFAPLYATEGTIAPGSALAREVEKIRSASADSVERMSLATRLVQDSIGYLANGMANGHYTPQSPAQTWELRYGDCKAKTLLLLSILHHLDIEAEAFTVNSSIGDAVPDLLPTPGAFDHVIVRASIGGTPYWLDGTATGARLSNIADTLPFGVGLPIRATGAGLERIEPRVPAVAAVSASMTYDQRGGIGLPTLMTSTIRFSGAMGSAINAALLRADDETRRDMLESLANSASPDIAIISTDPEYDEQSGIFSIGFEGLVTSPWEKDGARWKQSFTALETSGLQFEHDRSRQAWRDIPINLGAPNLSEITIDVLLPEGETFRMGGRADTDLSFANNRIVRKAVLDGSKFTITERVESLGGELPASRLPAEKAIAGRIANSMPFLLSTTLPAQAWEYAKPELKKQLKPYEQAYATFIERRPDEAFSYTNRAYFRWLVADLDGSADDYSKAIEIDPSDDNYESRAYVQRDRGKMPLALEDMRKAFEISPSSSTALELARLLGLQGETEEALGLLDEFDDYGDLHEAFVYVRADILALADRKDEGLGLIEALVEESPGKSEPLNMSCWYRARFQVGMDTMMDVCNAAVEQAENAGDALDSRALAWFKSGDLAKAREDADAAAGLGLHTRYTRYVRGFILRELGEKAGADEISYLARTFPGMATEYAHYGLKP